MENNLEVAGVERESLVCHPLSVRTCKSLVDKCRAMNAGQMMNWEDFKLKFSKYHVPQGLIKKMRDEFRELKQGRMSVVEYRDKFLTCQGPPKPEATTTTTTTTITSNNHPNTHNNGNNNNHNTGPKTGSNAVPINLKDKSTVNCYECGVVGHYSNECPKKLARIAKQPLLSNSAALGRRNQNNNNGRLYHMTAKAQEAPRPCQPSHLLAALPTRAAQLLPHRRSVAEARRRRTPPQETPLLPEVPRHRQRAAHLLDDHRSSDDRSDLPPPCQHLPRIVGDDAQPSDRFDPTPLRPVPIR
ncbi:hypothetical protein QYE76_012699 [Lolium multiflorum]|uniref:CCHC-type domain-containing protein n=1 Tax=Lolium multiflorum TaxID=4521 RepID=A0AAD8X6I6_LOLMU|nr:hypothetical protein QYE76_012699 [Lolium multiflorum]